MDLDKLYKIQEELDQHILEKHNIKMSEKELLDSTILALLVEVGELANTTRCFKHWSTKGMMDKEIVLEELADCLHFYFSIGNQLEIKLNSVINKEYLDNFVGNFAREENITKENIIIRLFILLISRISALSTFLISNLELNPEYNDINIYDEVGIIIQTIQMYYKFTDEEIEQAYLKKHEENYKRQREGY